MKTLDANKLLQRIKHAQAHRAVRNGFDDNYLYSDALLNLNELDIKKFANLRGIIGVSEAQKKTADIVVNAQGLNRTELKKISDELKREPTPEEISLRIRRKIKKSAISILRGISVRMPLLIYGAEVSIDEDITIEKFTAIVDDSSWAEFMPSGVTKELFRDFIKYYDPEVFIQAGHIIRQHALLADNLKPSARIDKIADLFATFKNPDKETVLTPWRVVKLHIDSAFDQNFFSPDKKILDINAKTGLYPLYVAHKIFKARLGTFSEDDFNFIALQKFWDKILADNVFVICKTPMAKTISRRTLLGFRAGSINAHCFDDLINQLKNKSAQFVKNLTNKSFWNKGVGKMFFDAVVGNPPYQVATRGNNKNSALPVYHLFLENSFKLADKVSLITPARFLSNAGVEIGDFTKKFLSSEHIKIVKHFIKSQDVFPSSDIKGGVIISLYDKTQTFEPIGIFIPFEELASIYKKVVLDNENFRPFSEIMTGTDIYHWTEKMHSENPAAVARMSKGHKYDISTNAFELLPEIFFDEKPDDGKEYVQFLGREKNRRTVKWVRRDYLREHPTFHKWEALLPASNGSGALGEVLVTPLVGHTSTFITAGAFDSELEARACIAYIKSKFCRAMLGILKVTQHNPPQTWAFVPLQDFTAASDIDWSASIAEIDKQLYRKYDLSDAEIKFIETHVKAME